MKLFDLERSGNCYKIRLFLSILDIEYQKIAVNTNEGENRTNEFLSMNPNGLVPVLKDGQITVFDSAAILSYLAKTYADDKWFPSDPVLFSNVVKWLAFEQREGRYGLARARAILINNPTQLARSGSLEESQALGTVALEALNNQLLQTTWLAGGTSAAICDLACYPYTAMSGEGGLSLESYPAIQRWMAKIEKFDGYVSLPVQFQS
jgi:glutathione S-transferase